MEAILLAGGLGTRLHDVTGDRYPKSLAKVDGRPFIHYVIRYLESQEVNRFIIAISHHGEMIVDELNRAFPSLDVSYSKEHEPMGTGGAIKQAMALTKEEQVLVVNSDSFMEFSLKDFVIFSRDNQAQLSLVCTQVEDVSRFGAADIDDNNKLVKFFEKGREGNGFINSGIYLVNRQLARLAQLEGKFSFENDVLSHQSSTIYAMKNQGLFFDIGTPDDFEGAQRLVAEHGHLFDS